ncbi:hypothetical protein [Olsenella sp. oral taxon 807]|uniref:hypothetical protein n=1 Tax=Olsenella sp. oral taxon 807 TaxID=712411 RepID=UPI000B2DCD2D|nr:hypothetical protein [Olsenella sp. oral taxon 807]
MRRMNPKAQRLWEANERLLAGNLSPFEWIAWSICYVGICVGIVVLLWVSPR